MSPIYKFRDWIDADKIVLKNLAKNPSPATIHYFDKRPQDRLRLYRHLLKQNIICDTPILHMFLNDDWQAMSHMPDFIVTMERHPEKIDWEYLCENPAAVHLIQKVLETEGPYSDKISWMQICCNKSAAAMEILSEHTDKIMWPCLSANPFALDLLKQHPDGIDWENLCTVEDARVIEFLEQNPDKIHWDYLSENSHPRAVALLAKNPAKIHWTYLHFNTADGAIDILAQNRSKINTCFLCHNTNPRAIALLEEVDAPPPKYITDRMWENLSKNPAAIDLLRRHPDKINWQFFSENPAIFVYDYAGMRAAPMGCTGAALHEDFAKWWWSPARVAAFLAAAGGDIDALDDMT